MNIEEPSNKIELVDLQIIAKNICDDKDLNSSYCKRKFISNLNDLLNDENIKRGKVRRLISKEKDRILTIKFLELVDDDPIYEDFLNKLLSAI